MLRPDDDKLFASYFAEAEKLEMGSIDAPDEVLSSTKEGISYMEFWRLTRSLQIISIAGLIDKSLPVAAEIIKESTKGALLKSLDDREAWVKAIRWAISQPTFQKIPEWTERVLHVGNACLRLKKKGLKIHTSAYGPYTPDETDVKIVNILISLIRLIGGLRVVHQIFRVLVDTKCTHDGFFVLGNKVSSTRGEHEPAYPWGWLLSLSLANLEYNGSARKPEVAWKNLIETSRDFAAVRDCQRYSQFEQLTGIVPEEFSQIVQESISWRELFTFPQTSPLVIDKIEFALKNIVTEADEEGLGFSFSNFFREIQFLLSKADDNNVKIYSSDQIKAQHPIVWSLTRGARGNVNKGYRLPWDSIKRTQDRTVIFEVTEDKVAVLPRAILANAVCEMIFRLIWERLPYRASKITGDVLELAIMRACEDKMPEIIKRDIKYGTKSKKLQLDVCVREENSVIMIETKAKSLTVPARSGNIYSAFKDYSNSFLDLLFQLVRHEDNLRKTGFAPITKDGEDLIKIDVSKVAISPLSYGSLMDRILTTNVLSSVLGQEFSSISVEPEAINAVREFNDATSKLLPLLDKVADKDDKGALDLFPYLIDVFWLDLGQFIYILNRAPSVSAALQCLKHVSYGSRDFWSEIAFADIQGLTEINGWRQV